MKHLLVIAAVLLGAFVVACYQDDPLHPPAIASTKVFLTDGPFPYDSVSIVNIYVTRIEATAHFDTLGAGEWQEIAAPRKRFDLLTLQQGVTAFIGEGALDAGHYQAIRMSMNVDSSSIRFADGTAANVNWNSPGFSEITLHALVEEPLAVSATGGAEIVIDFDVGRSFQYNLFGTKEFTFIPWLRAINSAATGAIEGTVTRSDSNGSRPVQNANVTVYSGESFSQFVVATGHTDPQGDYRIAFLRVGTYIVRFEQLDIPSLAPVTLATVSVTAGAITTLSAVLPPAGAGGAFLRVSGPSSVGVGGTIVLRAAVGDSIGDPLPNPTITWSSRDTLIAVLLDSSYADTLQFVLGRQEGSTWIVAQSGALSDSALIQVLVAPTPNLVASVTVSPATRTLSIGDSMFFSAVARDSAGAELTNRQISWFLADSLGVVDLLVSVGGTAVVKAQHSGSTVLRAVSEGKSSSASITVQ